MLYGNILCPQNSKLYILSRNLVRLEATNWGFAAKRENVVTFQNTTGLLGQAYSFLNSYFVKKKRIKCIELVTSPQFVKLFLNEDIPKPCCQYSRPRGVIKV